VRVIGGLSVVLLVAFPQVVWPAEFSGQVVDPQGNPVEEATVWLTGEGWDEAWPVFAETPTDAAGRFRLSHEPPEAGRQGLYAVCALAEGYALAWWERSATSRPGILLKLERAFAVRGRVVDAAGRPVAGVRPRLSFLSRMAGFDPLEIGQWSTSIAPPDRIAAMLVAETNAQGEFGVRRLPPGAEPSFRVEQPGYARQDVRLDWTELAKDKPIEIKLEPGATIRGRVAREDGTPVSGVGVAAYGGGKAKTDEQGRYEIGGLPEAAHQVHLDELPLTFTAKAVEVKVRRGSTVENVDLTVVDGLEVKGVVTDQTSGKPVPGVEICCNTAQQPKVGMAWPTVRTDENGRYSVRAPEGPAELRTLRMPRGWHPAKGFGEDFRRITVTAKEAPFEENFEVVPARALSGQVLDPNGKPAAGAVVVAVDSVNTGFPHGAVSDEEGRFSLPGTDPNAQYSFRAYLGEAMTLDSCSVEKGATSPVALQLAADARPTLTGRIVSEDGKPVPYALVRADAEPTEEAGGTAEERALWRGLMAQTITDEEGNFLLRAILPAMAQHLRIHAAGYAQTGYDGPALGAGDVADVGDIPLEVADLTVSGKVVDDQGIPVPNVTVEARPKDFSGITRVAMATTDLDGRFRFEDLPRANVQLTVDTWTCDSRPVEAGPGRTEVTVTAIPRESQVLYTHLVTPALTQAEGARTCVLRRLYRYKGLNRSGVVEQFLAPDLDLTTGDRTVQRPRARALDDQGRELAEAASICLVGQKMLMGCDLPRAGTRSITLTVEGALVFPDIPIPEELTAGRDF